MRRGEREIQKSVTGITRRTAMLGGAQASVMALLGWRMHQLQVDQAETFRLLAEENRINIRLLPPARGLIFDRNGVLLAGNEPNYRVTIVREDAGDVDLVLARFAEIVPLPEDEIEKLRREIFRRSPFVPITVAERLTWDQLSQVAVNAPALPGLTPEVGLSRIYPLDADFAHVVGYVGPVSDFDLQNIEDPDPLLQIPRFQIGKTGVEKQYEPELRGSAGTKRIEVNAAGRVMRELDRVEGRPGADVQLTLDYALQNYVEARLSGESAAAVVIEIATGDVLALGSAPSFDPNLFVRGISSTDFNGLLNDPYRPLACKAVQGTYPPGSTFKMVTALAALEDGLVAPDERVFCPGHLDLGNRRFHCWKRGGHGRMDLVDSLRESCDVYYYDICQRVGMDRISAMAQKLGLGVRHDLPINAVAEGLMPDRAWKERTRGEPWLIGDTLNASIGQGFLLASPVQLAVMAARLVSGRNVQPNMVRSVDGRPLDRPAPESLGFDPAHLTRIRQAMDAVVNQRSGTAYSARVVESEYRIGGKTGTSQVRNITAAERASGVVSNEDLPWERRDHALFVGYGPTESPRYAIAVVVEHGGGGSAVAAPIARDILLRVQYGEVPPLSAYPDYLRSRIAREQDELVLRAPVQPSRQSDRA